ncbi:glycosyltransferase family 4 protein [Mucilaginibacter sp. KACC 22063]|uniref:glycosyltransferase family 4 protein n=1 Tax=Mucilaginibacter sp. KACC 22063 TaxID=3025666 RepID=UPI002365C821|nr:glycosyltransferase family 4 protein [Mucilaginibacter sp. KACC 22063]WDF57136.1 glycosyltransferase family 4 protein [Mucilaginibacter sp. KACC 22063]
MDDLGNRRLIYILNHYSKNSVQHFFHVVNLLYEIADHGVEIALVIEKCDGQPDINHPNVLVIPQQAKGALKRRTELYSILTKLCKQGYHKCFIRISTTAALTAIAVSLKQRLEVYYWHSGTVKEFNDEQPFGLKKIKNYFKSTLPFSMVKKYTTWFVTGPESMKAYYEKVHHIDGNKIKVLYNDIDINRFNTATDEEKINLKKELDIPLDRKIILFVHRLSPVRKSLFYMPYVLEKFYEQQENHVYQSILIGEGNEKPELERMVVKAGLQDKVFILGGKPNNIIQKYYQVADIFINPTYAEGFPRVLIEAMATGLPVVTTDAGGIADILGQQQQAFMVNKDNRDDFAIKLSSLAADEEMRLRLKNENLETVKRFSTPVVAQMYIDVIFNK